MTEWIAIGLGVVALAAVIGWLKAYREAQDWERVCIVLGDQYDSLMVELNQPPPQALKWDRVHKHWVN
jgi:hypothetical protein